MARESGERHTTEPEGSRVVWGTLLSLLLVGPVSACASVTSVDQGVASLSKADRRDLAAALVVDEAVVYEQQLKSEPEVQRCMAEAGFEYELVVDEPPADEPVDSAAFREDMGYGILAHGLSIVVDSANEVVPNEEILEGMDEDQQDRWHDREEMCQDRYGSELSTLVVLSDPVSEELTELWERVEVEVELSGAYDRWQSCAADQGYSEFAAPSDVDDYFQTLGQDLDEALFQHANDWADECARESTTECARPLTREEMLARLGPEWAEAYEELLAHEIAVAVALEPCDAAFNASYASVEEAERSALVEALAAEDNK